MLHGFYDRPGVSRGADGYHHPASEDDLVALVRRARRESAQLRVRGSAHSVARAIYTDDVGAARAHCDVMLDRLAAVSFDDAAMRVTAQGGCHLGVDPRDPTGTSTHASSLVAQLDARAWALPDLGGVSHQTVAGFLMTGSCGGSVQHGIEEAVVGYRLVDGAGRVHDLVRGRDELFDAVGSSLGLLGIVTAVTFQCVPRYDLIGRETVTPEGDCGYALTGDGEAGLEGFLRRTEYARLMWWPQEGVRRVVTWQAARMRPSDYDARTGPPGALRARAYSALGDLGEAVPARVGHAVNLASQAAAGVLYDAIAGADRRFAPVAAASPAGARVGAALRGAFAARALPAILRAFVPVAPPQRFWDSWWNGLPMDNQMSERRLPTEFTEIWVPLDRAGEVMRALRAHYDRAGYDATGAFLCELYAARATRAWMHPGYGRDSLRVDLFWFARNAGDPTRGWFVQFWELLRPFAYRLHWGKHLPADSALGHEHLRAHTPRWDDFMAARRELDPGGVFLTRYWREALGVTA